MNAVIKLRHEPRLREKFEYSHVHNNTMLVDRRTNMGQSVSRDRRCHACAGGRALPHLSLAAHPRGRDRPGRTRRTRWDVVGLLVRREPPVSRRGARPGRSMGVGHAGGAGRCVTCPRRSVGFGRRRWAMPPARAIRSNHGSQASRNFLSYPYRLRAQARCALRLRGGAARPALRLQTPCKAGRSKGLCRWREIAADVMFHCATRAHCANPLRGSSTPLRSVTAGTRNETALARLGPARRATVAQSLRSLRPHHSRTTPGQSFRTRWLRCARVSQRTITSGQTLRKVQPQIGRSS